MKRIFLLCLCFIGAVGNAGAQQAQADVHIGVVCPEQTDYLSTAGLARLEHKVEQIASANGVATWTDGTFVMYPVIDLLEVRTVESGMRNITVAKAEMVLTVVQISTGMKINTVAIPLSGSGYNESDALANAVSGIDVRSPIYAKFLSESKERIYSYYETNCDKLLQKARALEARQQYEKALAELACFPASLPSYAKVLPVMIAIYNHYQDIRCAELVQQAKGCIALQDYSGAVECLMKIDPESQCKAACSQLLEHVRKQVGEEEARAIERQFRVFDTLVGLEKQRMSLIRDMAEAYYSNQPAIHYTQIVK